MKAVLFGIWLLVFSIFLIICDNLGITPDLIALFSLPSVGFVLYGIFRGEWNDGPDDDND